MNDRQTRFVTILIIVVIVCIGLWAAYKQVKEHYAQDDPKLQELQKIFTDFFNSKSDWEPPLDMLNKRHVMDEVKLYRGEKSYTINKEKIFLCMKDRKGQYYSNNILIYVLGHEIAHSLCDEVGHTEKFHIIFEALLEQLTNAEIYSGDKNFHFY